MISDAKALLEVAGGVATYMATNKEFKHNSLPEYTKSARLMPIVLIDKQLLTIDPQQITALEQTILSLYCGYYLQAVNMTMQVGNVNVMKVLDQFSTDRDYNISLMSSPTVGIVTGAMKSLNAAIESLDGNAYFPDFSLEAFDPDQVAWLEKQEQSKREYTEKREAEKEARAKNDKTAEDAKRSAAISQHTGNISNDKTIHNITDESNLVVGKILDVNLTDGKNSISIPVTATLIPKSIFSEDFLAIIRANSIDKSASARWHQWKSGEIKFIKDYLLCQDIIEADKKALLADKTGTMLAIRSKRTKGAFVGLLHGYASPNEVSSMIIISKKTANEMQLILKGKLDNYHIRQEYFQNSSTMMLVVVDPVMERFTIYQRGIETSSEHTFHDIRLSNKKQTTDINSILNAYKIGAAAPI